MSNHLQNERSAYLRQHANNPVDWYPWGAAAFEKAQREDKPVFLSIGYASCHWCHVMAQESFEDASVAAVLNRSFIAIKVDREERPDVDAVYLEACTALTGGAGWPLTVLMTAQQKPFFAGTYLPKENVGARIGLLPLLLAVEERWRNDRRGLLTAGEEITALLRRETANAPGKADASLADRAAAQLLAAYDAEYGGFGTAPKFPAPQQLLFLMRHAKLSGQRKERAAVEHTLRQMARGGICDQLGGGFSRYSTDREWLAPHFEKTLYDNALLALCYTEAWQEGRYPFWRQTAEATLDYCLRELADPSGGFYSGQDADSEGEEGKYYLFTPAEVKAALGEEDGRHFCESYDITDTGNFHGKSIPNLLLNQRWNLLPEGLDDLRERLRLWRAERMPLGTDRKMPTGWNGLLLAALARAARVFDDRRYRSYALGLADFLLKRASAETPETLCALCYPEGPSPLPAQLEDYAFSALGFLECYPLDYDPAWLLRALALAEEIERQFSDPSGGYYASPVRGERLLKRPKTVYDGALPSGNTAAAVLFDRLARLSGEQRWRALARRQADYLAANAADYPAGISYGLCALPGVLGETRELVCIADSVPETLRRLTAGYSPELTVLLKRPGDDALTAFAPFTAEMKQQDGKTTFYLCRNGSCELPFTE